MYKNNRLDKIKYIFKVFGVQMAERFAALRMFYLDTLISGKFT